MANAQVGGKLKTVMSLAYSKVRNAVGGTVQVSVGSRVQGRQSTEVIITQTAHSFQTMRGLQARHVYTLDVIAFDKSYVTAADLSDDIMLALSNAQQTVSGNVDMSYFPKTQIMYYTDEDDFAVATTVDVVVVEQL